MDNRILNLYDKGLSPREIVNAFKEMYGTDVLSTLISKVTDRLLEQIAACQSPSNIRTHGFKSASFT